MEFVEGEDLFTVMKREGPLTGEKTLDYMNRLADALVYMQELMKPVIYRDLKPSNIIVDSNGKLKIIDFGTARYFSPTGSS